MFLSPGDVWAASVAKGTDGYPVLKTSDKSCTLPHGVGTGAGTKFLPLRVNSKLTGDALANELREGYAEVLNMADIPPNAATDSIASGVFHVDGVPPDCTVVDNLANWDTRLTAPSTGLFANWTIINVPKTTTWSGDAYALEGRVNGTLVDGLGKNVYFQQSSLSLADANVAASSYTSDPLIISGGIVGALYDLPDLSTPYFTGVTDPVVERNNLSNALATAQAAAEYYTDANYGAATNWVVSTPTRRYYAAVAYGATPTIAGGTATSNVYFQTGTSGNIALGNATNGCQAYQIAVKTKSLRFFDREEQSVVKHKVFAIMIC